MKLLHTSDWHLGRTLYGRKRYEEFTRFLSWLTTTIEAHSIDILLIAGDVFDTTNPSNRAQELYYGFLSGISRTCCRHVVIIAGNHDSPSFLEAPRQLLRALNVHVVGAVTMPLSDEVMVLRDGDRPEVIVCAVPYLRDRDLRRASASESMDDKSRKLTEGLKDHYAQVGEHARALQESLVKEHHHPVPIIGMGHLFATGGKTTDGDGVRDLYVGSLAQVGHDAFPPCFDYLALGHLHAPQRIGGCDHLRYCGAPLPMGYGEASQDKKVIVVSFEGSERHIEEVTVPRFQALVRLAGTLPDIISGIETLRSQNSTAWLELEYTGATMEEHLRDRLEEAVDGSEMEIRRIRNRRVVERALSASTTEDRLDELTPGQVFARFLEAHEIPPHERETLTQTHDLLLTALLEADRNAE